MIENVEKRCSPPDMFHPVSMTCERPESVALVNPACGSASTPINSLAGNVPPTANG